MEDDLTWLARTEHEWPKDAVYVSRHENAVEWHCVELSFIGYGHFTIDQWLARRAELQSKPSWADHPDARCFAQNSDGGWFKHTGGAQARPVNGFWSLEENCAGRWEKVGAGEVLGDWRDTLERRPVDLSEPAVTARLTEATENVLAAVPALMGEKFSIDRNDWHERGDLPPVGEKCVLHAAENNGEEVMFIGLTSERFPVFETVQKRVFVERGEYKFSPIRTVREKAIEEMKRYCPFHGSWDTVGRIYAEALYDAGYRKQNLPAD
ncbi:hypothetical protein [Aeromonas salmonicida]|uniref:hypothetical protein n=1 Tax=Aeromonas salmonicida TaxID=645 RepID=UPI000371576E|nr:hypothetical protein [Aeromonas salmonicida]